MQEAGSGVGRLSAWGVSALIRALSFLSLKGQRRLGRALGHLVWHLRREDARTADINVRICFPELDGPGRRRLSRETFANTGMLFTELGAIFHWPEARWRVLTVELDGAEYLRTVGDSAGVLVLVPHIGNWEYLSLFLGALGVTALYDPPRARALEELIRSARSRAGATLLPIDAGGLRAFYRALAGGGLAALLPDQVPDRPGGVYAEFFGHRALTMTLAHRLLTRTGARAVLGAALRCPGGFRLVFRPLDDGELRDPDPAVSARAMNAAIERLVVEAPDQYQWQYRRFKRQPRGVASPYVEGRPRRRR